MIYINKIKEICKKTFIDMFDKYIKNYEYMCFKIINIESMLEDNNEIYNITISQLDIFSNEVNKFTIKSSMPVEVDDVYIGVYLYGNSNYIQLIKKVDTWI